ncbi:MAG TPA: adenine deaminase [Thermomicrobiales bacterium]|nr:adenine deaminase [Thermomicrobiales bacterium]
MAKRTAVTGLPTKPPFDVARWRRRLAVARGEYPADLVLVNGHIVNVFSGELERADVAIVDGWVAGIGQYADATERIDCTGKVITPSFIDAHVHLESALVWVTEFARAVVPRGTGAVVTDPHEIANVAGLVGVNAIREACAVLPLRVAFTVPSCVPASEHESPGAAFGEEEIAEALAWPESVALGELMDFQGVISGNARIAAKVAIAGGIPMDGHAPGLSGPALQAYVGAGPGADHESTSLGEAREKLRAGLMIMIREGSSERNLKELLPLVNDTTYPRCCFASDDRDCHMLLHEGHVDAILRQAIAEGLDPVRAVRMATWNPARHWGLDGLGAVAPGYRADLAVLGDLERAVVDLTLYRGQVVARGGKLLTPVSSPEQAAPGLRDTVRTAPLRLRDLRLDPDHATVAVEVVAGQIVTRLAEVTPVIRDGWAVSDPGQDLLKLVCVERHHATGRTGVGYVRGFGLRRGALASTIAHDAHNVIAVGVEDADILAAVATVAESQGGLAVVVGGQVLAHVPLPIGGILSDQPLEHVAECYAALERAARALGSDLPSPFGLLAFMALSVIPEARVTDRGFLRVGEAG